jgi:esterase/lipase
MMTKNNDDLLKVEIAQKVPLYILIPIQTAFQIIGNMFPKLAAHIFLKLMNGFPRQPLRPKEKDFLKEADQLQFKFGNTDLAGYSFGKGPSILIVHGLMGSTANFHIIISDLVKNGFRVIAFDLLNHGNSPSGPIGIDNGVDMIREVIQQAGELYGTISHSGGGLMTTIALSDGPEVTQLQKRILVSTPPYGKNAILSYLNFFRIPKKVFPYFWQRIESRIMMKVEDFSVLNALPQYKKSKRPFLLTIHDKDDKEVPIHFIDELFKGDYESELLVTENLGHFKILKDENVSRKIVEFMKS